MSPTMGPEEVAPAADGAPARQREVTGYDGTFEEAVEADLIDKPPPMIWYRWQAYRKLTGSTPTLQEDGWQSNPTVEAKIYRRVMRAYYGPNYRDMAGSYDRENPMWFAELQASQHAHGSQEPASGASAAAGAPASGASPVAGATAPTAGVAALGSVLAFAAPHVHLPAMEQGVVAEEPPSGHL